MTAPEQKTPFWVRCVNGHRWVAVYLPMEAIKAAKAMQRATCPHCGESKKIYVDQTGGSDALQPDQAV